MKRFELRLEPELFARIERLAWAERRSISQQMRVLIERGLPAPQPLDGEEQTRHRTYIDDTPPA